MRGVFLDMSKAFEKVWHPGLTISIDHLGCKVLIIPSLKFLCHRHQRVLLNGQTFERLTVKAGVPQGSLLGSLLFLIYINSLPDNLTSTMKFEFSRR